MDSKSTEALNNYVNHGIDPGGFIKAVLCNDLYLAVRLAHQEDIDNLKKLILYIYNNLPYEARGSNSNVEKWIRRYKKETNPI